MATNSLEGLQGWRYGLHPGAAGAIIRSIERRELDLGDAFRVEMETTGSPDLRLVQYFIATKSGGWAMWISSPSDELASHDGRLASIKHPDDETAADGSPG